MVSVELRQQILKLVKEYAEKEHAPQPFVPGQSPVPVSGRVYDGSDMSSLVDSSLDFWLTAGRFNSQFEGQLKSFLGAKHALTVNSGSSANLVAFSALTSPTWGERALKPGDEVITVAAGFPTTINPMLLYQMVPVFVDVHLPTYNIDPQKIEEAITPKTKAIMVAHTLGNPFDIDAVMEVAKKHNLWVIEDCCDALGSRYNGQQVGTFGDIGTLSFYPAHHITMGEGGAVFTNKQRMKKVMESMRDWGRDCWCPSGADNTCKNRFSWELGELPEGYDHKYIYSHLGYNLKITDMQAAVGCSQLNHLDSFISLRKRNFNYLNESLSSLKEFFILPEATEKSEPSWFGFPITIRDGKSLDRKKLLLYLNEKKIGTRLIFGGNLTRQPYMKGVNYRLANQLDNTDIIMNQSFWLGVYPGLSLEMLSYMVENIHDFIKNSR